ncbi:MAG: hypothetical protein KC464_35330 [Myxococcales bacterium]|nr:hypothetical protein [Myxococcales bacterium]MCB9508264.1 hypothetical protein [Myxococcales bacterium]MCB9521437.1 hypothetical protein [Myxococcales bacterium]
MATSNRTRADVRALRTIEALHGTAEDVPSDVTPDPASAHRMRSAIDTAFAQAWRARRDLAKAESRRRADREAGFLELAGDALRARIAQLRAALGGQLQLAHRNLGDMSDDDLRTLLADIEEVIARKGLVS